MEEFYKKEKEIFALFLKMWKKKKRKKTTRHLTPYPSRSNMTTRERCVVGIHCVFGHVNVGVAYIPTFCLLVSIRSTEVHVDNGTNGADNQDDSDNDGSGLSKRRM